MKGRAVTRGWIALCGAVALILSPAAQAEDRWISAWGTAQQLAPMPPPRLPPRPAGETRPAPPPPATPSPILPTPERLKDQTVRMVVRPTVKGGVWRVQLSNASGGEPLRIGRAAIAKSAEAGAIRADTSRALSFAGQADVTIQPGAVVFSDPVTLDVAALELLAVSIHLPEDVAVNTLHPLGLRTTYVAQGERTGDANNPFALRNC